MNKKENTKARNCKLSIIVNGCEEKTDFKKLLESFNKQELATAGQIQILFLDAVDEKKKRISKKVTNLKIEFHKDKDELLKAVNGKYVCYSNGVDLWEKGSLDKLCDYLDKNSNIGCAIANELYKNRMGSKLKIKELPYEASIENNPENAQKNPRLMVFRKELLEDVPAFYSTQQIEELLVALEIILKAVRYVVIPKAILWCKGKCKIAPDTAGELERLKKASLNVCGEINKYTNYFILSVIYGLISQLSSKEILTKQIQQIPDEIIATSNPDDTENGFAWEEKQYAYILKHGREEQQKLRLDEDGLLYFANEVAFNIVENSLIQMKILEVDSKRGVIIFEGFDKTSFIDQKAKIYVRDEEGKLYSVETHDYEIGDFLGCDGEIVSKGRRFYAEIPLRFGMRMEFVMKYSYNNRLYECKFSKGNFIKLHPQYTHSYYVKKPYIIQIIGCTIIVTRDNLFRHLSKELAYMIELIANSHLQMVCYRMAYWGCKLFSSKKPIWLINDRPHNAGDNGEVLFKYLMNSSLAQTHKIYFVISNKSPDYERIKNIGPVLDYYSHKHKLKFLLADKIISSIGNELPTNPFGGSRKIYYDLYKADFVYLRHGVSHNDQSVWLNKFRRNYRLINSSSKREYESLIEGNYLYTEEQVILCGLPRFDNLCSENNKKILFLPTWRKNLQGIKKAGSEKREYSTDFIESDFFKFYNKLINDERLLEAMKRNNLTGDFYLHPVMSAQIDDFKSNDLIKVHSEIANYQEAFKESNIMITDYSSVAFDFAYLKKPVVYAQFDIDKFYKEHSWDKGYFSYENDAFGHVTHDYETTVSIIINYINNNFEMEPEYKKRVEDFFAYTDKNNCKRIIEAITKLERNE